MTADPFQLDGPPAPPERKPGEFKRDAKGTPWVANPAGDFVKPKRKADEPRLKMVRYSRPSGYGELIQNTYNLQKWAERMIVAGFVLGVRDDVDDAPPVNDDDQVWREYADAVARKAKELAKHMLAAERGTHAHELTELNDTERDPVAILEQGEALGITSDVAGHLLNAWRTMLATYGLEVLATELAVVNDTYNCAGTLDRIMRLTVPLRFVFDGGEVVVIPAGTVLVLDLKTGKLRHDNGSVSWWDNYPIQIAIYAGSVGYNPDTDQRYELPWPVDQRWAIIAHLDVLGAIEGEENCELILVDLEVGRRGADIVFDAKAYGNTDKFSLVGTCSADRRPPTMTPADQQNTIRARPTPDEGGEADEASVQALERAYGALDKLASMLIGDLVREAQQGGAPFHLKGNRTVRRFEIVRGLVHLAPFVDDKGETLRSVLAAIVGDVAHFANVAPGHILGTLGVDEARRFAAVCDEFATGSVPAHVDEATGHVVFSFAAAAAEEPVVVASGDGDW